MEKLKELLWGTPTICVLLGTGIYLMILLKGLPIRKLPAALRLSLGMGREAKDGEEKGISAFSCLATELASTIGTGNILGVVGAMELGGPGALFWMLLSAFTGLPTKLVETALSVKYKSASKEGEAVGGPMVTLAKAFPAKRLGKALGIFYAALAVAGSFCMGNLVQANSIALSLRDAFGIEPKRLGFLLTFLTILAVLGGMKKISKIATFLVPAMGSLYLAGCLGILLCHLENLVPAIAQIIRCAFHPRSALGGLFGTATCSFSACLRNGISRGVFSNEAGLGAGGISAAFTKEKSYVRQGLISMTGVFYDTILICTITGLACVVSGVAAQGPYAGGLMSAVFEGTYGSYGRVLLAICITLFAFATILGWAVQGESAFAFLTGGRFREIYRLGYGFLALPGAMLASGFVWDLAEVINALMIFPNLLCVLALAPGICAEIRNYELR